MALNRPLLVSPGLKMLLGRLLKAFDETKHPRHPEGSAQGGEFAPKGGGGATPAGGTITSTLPSGCRITKTKDGKEVRVTSPYHDAFPYEAKKLGGKWNSATRQWGFSAAKQDQVVALVQKIYGAPRRNEYSGTCRRCHKPVGKGEGFIEQVNGKWLVEHEQCPEAPAAQPEQAPAESAPTAPVEAPEATGGPAPEIIEWSKGEGYGGRDLPAGTVVRDRRKGKEGFLYILGTKSRYVREDGLSFGVGDDSGYIYNYRARPATAEEAVPLLEREAKSKAAAEAEKNRMAMAEKIRAEGEYPNPGEQINAEGDPVSDRANMYGGGDWFVIGPEYIWYVQNNGADGDNWSQNNVRTGGAGGIGWRLPYTDELAAQVRALPERKS